ncbi:hypothetical protein Tco_0093991, partial [Tanacetum coccineum]
MMEIESDGQHVKKDVKDKIEIARAALIQQEIELILWSWDDLNSEGDAAEGVLGVGGDGSNSLKTVDRISKIGSDNVVRDFEDVKSLSSKRISVCNIVSDNDDMVADGNHSKVGKVYVADRMVSDPKKSKNVIVGEKKWQHKNLQLQLKKEKEKDKIANTGKAIADCPKVVFDVVADGKSD